MIKNKIFENTILLVDDESINLTVLTGILENEFNVLAVKSGRMALKVLNESKDIDLVILDINMPDMDGYDTLKEIRKDSYLATIPVIFITTLENDISEISALRTGAVDYIHKPIQPEILKLRLRTHLELKKNRDLLNNKNLWLEKEINRQVSEKTILLEISLTTIVGLAETRDTDTGNHILRTKEYVSSLAAKLKELHKDFPFSHDEIIIMAKAAQLHDIGKIGIPDAILLKPESLNKDEFEIMKTHSKIGGVTIDRAIKRAFIKTPSSVNKASDSFKLLDFARTIAFYHHEKWNGLGYPEGLQGEEIPLPARIMAIADVFDALTNKRIYKEKITLDNAIEIIIKDCGTHFDPSLKEAFRQCDHEFKEIYRQYNDN